MNAALRSFIDGLPLADTHEHLRCEAACLSEGADLLEVLFSQYPEPSTAALVGAALIALTMLRRRTAA